MHAASLRADLVPTLRECDLRPLRSISVFPVGSLKPRSNAAHRRWRSGPTRFRRDFRRLLFRSADRSYSRVPAPSGVRARGREERDRRAGRLSRVESPNPAGVLVAAARRRTFLRHADPNSRIRAFRFVAKLHGIDPDLARRPLRRPLWTAFHPVRVSIRGVAFSVPGFSGRRCLRGEDRERSRARGVSLNLRSWRLSRETTSSGSIVLRFRDLEPGNSGRALRGRGFPRRPRRRPSWQDLVLSGHGRLVVENSTRVLRPSIDRSRSVGFAGPGSLLLGTSS